MEDQEEAGSSGSSSRPQLCWTPESTGSSQALDTGQGRHCKAAAGDENVRCSGGGGEAVADRPTAASGCPSKTAVSGGGGGGGGEVAVQLSSPDCQEAAKETKKNTCCQDQEYPEVRGDGSLASAKEYLHELSEGGLSRQPAALVAQSVEHLDSDHFAVGNGGYTASLRKGLSVNDVGSESHEDLCRHAATGAAAEKTAAGVEDKRLGFLRHLRWGGFRRSKCEQHGGGDESVLADSLPESGGGGGEEVAAAAAVPTCRLNTNRRRIRSLRKTLTSLFGLRPAPGGGGGGAGKRPGSGPTSSSLFRFPTRRGKTVPPSKRALPPVPAEPPPSPAPPQQPSPPPRPPSTPDPLGLHAVEDGDWPVAAEHSPEPGACGGGARPPQQDVQIDFAASIEKVKDHGWYWGPISGEAAERILDKEPDGSFVVRDSSDHHYIFSLTFKLNGFVRHVRIEHDQGNFSFGSFTKFKSNTIVDFIENAVEHSRSGRYLFFLHRRPVLGPMRVQLLHPVSRFKRVQSLQHLCRYIIVKLVRRDLLDELPVPTRIRNYLNTPFYYSEQVAEEAETNPGIHALETEREREGRPENTGGDQHAAAAAAGGGLHELQPPPEFTGPETYSLEAAATSRLLAASASNGAAAAAAQRGAENESQSQEEEDAT